MINKEFFSEQELKENELKYRISVLEKQISKFKEYDQERKEYYKDALVRLGQLESTDEQETIRKLKSSINSQRKELNRLNKLLKFPDIPENFDKAATYDENIKLKARNSRLSEKNKELVKANRDLREKLAITILKNNGKYL